MWESNEVKLSGEIIYNKLHFDSLIENIGFKVNQKCTK